MAKQKPAIITVWCVKYALTQGIFQVQGYEKEGGWLCCPDRHFQSFAANEWTTDLGTARRMAESRRQKKLASLEKQIDRVRNVKIKVLTPED